MYKLNIKRTHINILLYNNKLECGKHFLFQSNCNSFVIITKDGEEMSQRGEWTWEFKII